MMTGYKIWKTNYDGRDYWLLKVELLGSYAPMKKFNTKVEATEYFLNKYVR